MKNSVKHNEWVRNNKDRVAAYKRKHYALHLKERKKSEKNYREAHKKEIKDRMTQYRKANMHKVRARGEAGDKIPLKDCEVCGTDKLIERHHYDYDKPLDIIFLCSLHHHRFHKTIPNNEIYLYDTGEKIKRLFTSIPSPYFQDAILV